jgi:hypothetical protein
MCSLPASVDAGCHAPEHLHQRGLAEDDRGVALLAAEQRRARVEVELGRSDGREADRVGVEPGPEPLQVDRRRRMVVQGVVAPHVAELVVDEPPDEGVLERLLLLGVVRRRHLVDVGAGAVGVRQLGELDGDPGALVGGPVGRSEEDPAGGGHLEGPPLAAEPARGLDVAGEVLLHAHTTTRGIWPVSPCRASSWALDGSRNQ